MAKIERFEDIEAWQKARLLCQLIHKMTLKKEFSKDYRLVGQIKGSSGSVMDNISEGFEREGNKEFILFLSYSKGSTGEVRSQLYRALDYNYINQEEFHEAFVLAEEISKILSGLMNYLRDSDLRGNKFK